jgi:predicted kinase
VFVLINGAFGIGKTTVARRVRALLPGAVLFDPEWIGFALRRLPGVPKTDGYQNLRSWRRLSILGARALGSVSRVVLLPMSFSDPAVLAEIRSGLTAGGRPVHHFCLVAPLDVVQARLTCRGEPIDDPRWTWVHRRAAECVVAHRGAEFATPTSTIESPDRVAADLAARITALARARPD